MGKAFNQIAGAAKCLKPRERQRDVEAIRRLVVSRVHGRGDSIDDAFEPRARAIRIDDLEEEKTCIVQMIVSACKDSLNVASFNSFQDAFEPPLVPVKLAD